MGCDIHPFFERKVKGIWEPAEGDFFDRRNYNVFAFLAGVRRSELDVVPISEPRGLPDDVSTSIRLEFERWSGDIHSVSWLMIDELLSFDYDAAMKLGHPDRVSPFLKGTRPTPPPEKNYRDYLGNLFFEDLDRARAMDIDRFVFGFDN